LITGEIAEKSDLLQGESQNFRIQVDRSAGVAQADFFGSSVVMRLDE
jgi:hypothetical protein